MSQVLQTVHSSLFYHLPPPPAHSFAHLSSSYAVKKFVPTQKIHLKRPEIQAAASYKVNHVEAGEYGTALLLHTLMQLCTDFGWFQATEYLKSVFFYRKI